ncbi:MAG: hypothetical protein LKF82_07185 [Acinetobacter populi]|jgi:hypothetical protein|uniref:hypothetical protein n=1 Tax=Acinetobacter populi TaxID=1582270 RepID=UPI002354FFBB|nr:hypothetical protein [Acinetobacter populi]MCH4247609.1 hypothetical protein [Acinetobacter populi]
MLVERFDFLELLRLAIAQGVAEGKNISKDVVLGEIALLSRPAHLWSTLLLEKVDFERIAIITPPQKQTRTFYSRYDFNYQYERRIEDVPGKVEFVHGPIKSANFFRVRNQLAFMIHQEMIKNNFKPNNAQGDLSHIAKGIAEVVLRGHLFVKAMCGYCCGLGKLELFKANQHIGQKPCEKCQGTGKRPYTLNEKITIAKLNVTKSGYSERYAKYELLGESIVAQWENEIRGRLKRSFYFEVDCPEQQECLT